MTQSDLACRIGRQASAISALESGRGRAPHLSQELITSLVAALDISPCAFFDWTHDMLRGRVATHLLFLGVEKLPESIHYCLREVHRIHPDVVGLSLMYPMDGICKEVSASLEAMAYSVSAPERIQRAKALGHIPKPGPRGNQRLPHNRLQPEESEIPGCDLTVVTMEVACGGGSLWLALSDPESPDDPELRDAAWHLSDVLSEGLAALQGTQVDRLAAQLGELQRRVDKLEGSEQQP